MNHVCFAETDEQIASCFAVMVQLRRHVQESDFVERVRRQQRAGYRLAFLEHDGQVSSVAGFRISECLSWGRFMYVDDLVTHEDARSQGHGDRLFDWLVEHARQQNCDEFHLDSGVQRFAAHRFYLRKRMIIGAYHFVLGLRSDSASPG